MAAMIEILDWRQAPQRRLERAVATGQTPASLQAGIRRIFGADLSPDQAVSRIVADVRQRGDDALREWTASIDGVALDQIAVSRQDIEAAYATLAPDLVDALQMAADRIRAFHEHQHVPSWTTDELGGVLGQRISPLARVGVYVPGGTAPLPSSMLMTAIPARVAGVREIIACTPPRRSDGLVPEIILAAAHVAGVDQVYRLGGAQAISALAYGTATVPRVDKIVGPGGLFVTLAKRQVFGDVGLDGLAGPTETVVIADDTANPVWVAADLLAQAEHDVLATAILLTPSPRLAQAVQAEVLRQVSGPDADPDTRTGIIEASLAGQGAIVITPDLETAVRLADDYAPEHLCLAVAQPFDWIDRIHNAGGIFLGEQSFEVLGDYVAGPSHVMPTGGTARFASPLNVLDFCRVTSIIGLDAATAARLSPVASKLARIESLASHAQAAEKRMEKKV